MFSILTIFILFYRKVKLATVVEGNQKTSRCRGGRYFFTLDTYLILLSIKLGGIKYNF